MIARRLSRLRQRRDNTADIDSVVMHWMSRETPRPDNESGGGSHYPANIKEVKVTQLLYVDQLQSLIRLAHAYTSVEAHAVAKGGGLKGITTAANAESSRCREKQR